MKEVSRLKGNHNVDYFILFMCLFYMLVQIRLNFLFVYLQVGENINIFRSLLLSLYFGTNFFRSSSFYALLCVLRLLLEF